MQQTISIALIPSLMSSFNSSGVPSVFMHNLAVNCLQRKWKCTDRLGQLAAQAMSPKCKITRPENITVTQSIESRAVCAAAPSCWKSSHHPRHQRPLLTSSVLLSIVLKLRPLYLLERSGPNNSQSRHSTPNRGFRSVCRHFENSALLLVAPVSAVLFIDLPGEVKFGLVPHNKPVKNTSNCITDAYGPPTEGHAGSLILFRKSMCSLAFV